MKNTNQHKVLIVKDNDEFVDVQPERDIASHSEAALVTPRDKEAWSNPTYNEDKRYKKERSSSVSQHAVNTVLQSYLKHQGRLRANIHLTIGRQRI